MANIAKYATSKGETRYRVRYRKPDGTQTDKRGFRRKTDAERWAAEHVTIAKARGLYVDPEGGRRLVGDLYEQWAREHEPMWKPTTNANNRGEWRRRCRDRWGMRRIDSLTTAELQAWVSDLTATAGRENAHRPFRVMRGICDMAVRDRLIAVNPCIGVELPKRPRRKERRVYLTLPQLVAFAEEARNCRRLGEERRALVLTLGLCGLRWGEACALQARDVDLDAGMLHVTRNLVYVDARSRWVEGTPKSGLSRDVPMPRIVMDALRPVCGRREPGERVFREEHGGPLGKQSLARTNGWWVRTLMRLGWRRDEWPVPHDLRHTAASLAVHAGANVKALQRMLGHATASMTLDVYADLFDSDLVDVARALDAALLAEVADERGQNVGKTD